MNLEVLAATGRCPSRRCGPTTASGFLGCVHRRRAPAEAIRRRRSTPFPQLFVAWGRTNALIGCVAEPLGRGLRRSLHALALVAALATTACSSAQQTTAPTSTTATRSRSSVASTTHSTESAPSSSTPATTIHTTFAVGQDAELRAVVRAFWDLYLELGAHTGPFDGEATRQKLIARATGAELNRLLAYLSSNAAAGYVVRGGIEIAPTVISANVSKAQVRDCYDDTTGLYRVSDNSRVDTDNPLRHQVLMSFERENGVWKVAAISDEGDGCHV